LQKKAIEHSFNQSKDVLYTWIKHSTDYEEKLAKKRIVVFSWKNDLNEALEQIAKFDFKLIVMKLQKSEFCCLLLIRMINFKCF